MALLDDGTPCFSSSIDSIHGSLDITIEEVGCIDNPDFVNKKSAVSCSNNIPKPPRLPDKACQTNNHKRLVDSCDVPKEIKEKWDQLFREGYGADVNISTVDERVIPAHFSVLSVASPVFRSFLQLSKAKNGIRCIKIPGVPYDAAYIFIRFLYSSCYEEAGMEKYVLHLLILSHTYSVLSLKKVCLNILENGWLTSENVVDVLQLARKCDAPRLWFICVRMIVKDFKTICSTEGWKVMKGTNPALEQELLEFVVEADSRKQERLKKIEERKTYLQLYEAMEALIHICKDGCGTIGPHDKVLKGSQVSCAFPACKSIEMLVRHFSACKARVPGGCVHCKRMWQLLELHSRMCSQPAFCKVPLCRHFKEKMQHQRKKDETKWKLLVSKVIAARNALGPFVDQQSNFL